MRWGARILAASLLLAACGERPSEEAAVAVVPDPPGYADFEPVVRQQFEALRAEVVRLEGDPAASADARADAWGALAIWHLAYQHLGSAAEALATAERLAPGDLRWPYYRAQLARVAGDTEAARRHFGRVLELRPVDVPTRVWLAELELEAGDLAAAERHVAAVLARDPAHPRALLARGRIALSRGDGEAAVAALEQVAAVAPEATEWRYPLGQALRMEGADAEARSLLAAATLPVEARRAVPLVDPLSAAVEELRVDERALAGRARRLAAEGRLDEALAVLPETPTTPHTLDLAFVLALRAGRLDAACRSARELARIEPDHPRAALGLGICAGESGDPATAERHYREALRLDPGLEEAYGRLAGLLLATGRAEEAMDLYRRWIAVAPEDPEARYGLAAGLLQTRSWRQAEEVLTGARRDFPDADGIAFLLSRLRAAAPEAELRDPRDALLLAREAFAARPDLARAESVAMALAAAGRFPEAVAWQEAARRATAAAGADAPWIGERLAAYRAGRALERPWDPSERFLPVRVEPPAGG